MLLIQDIALTWYKPDRGGAGAATRQRFPAAYLLKENPLPGETVVQTLYFWQDGETFLDAEQTAHRSMERDLPKLGFSPAQVEEEIQKRIFYIKKYRIQCYSSVEELNLTNLAIGVQEDRLSVSFFYDEHRSGAPHRRGHNQDYQDPRSALFGKDCLNETAFVLEKGQYGRLIWNERKTDYDTGTWYYQLHIYNLIHLNNTPAEPDIFIAKGPDFLYQKTAILY